MPYPTYSVSDKDFALHFVIDAKSGKDTFQHSGTVHRRAATFEGAKAQLSFELRKTFWPRVGQLLEREITITPA